MKIKKINACLAFAAALLLVAHVIYEIWSFITLSYNPALTTIIAYSFVTCVMLHGILSMYIVAFKHDRDSQNLYPKENKRTLIQRWSVAGVFLILPFHIKTMDWIPKHFGGIVFFVILLILSVLFYAFIFLHVGTSFTRGLITLGVIKEKKTQRIIDWIVWAICSLLFLASSVIITMTEVIIYRMN